MKLREHLLKVLQKIGLTESEAKFYFAVYKNKNLNINEIKQKAGLSTATAYRAFDSLRNKNLIFSSGKNWKENIHPKSLKILAEKLAKEQRKLAKLEFEITKCNSLMELPDFDSSQEPVEILLEPDDLIEHGYRILHKNWNELLCFGSPEKLIEALGEMTERNFVKLRVANGKRGYAIFTEIGPYAQEILPKDQEQLRNAKVKIEKDNQDKMLYIYGKEATIWQYDQQAGPRALVVHEPTLVDFYRRNFQKEWMTLRK